MSLADKVRKDLDALVTSHPMGEALEQLAMDLAGKIDVEEDGRVVASLAKELRATLHELAEGAEGDVDDLAAELSAPVRDPEGPE